MPPVNRQTIKLGLSQYSGSCEEPGCFVVFNPSSQFQYFPSNANTYLCAISGNVKAVFENGSVEYKTNEYTNTWSTYVDSWRRDESVHAYLQTPSEVFLTVQLCNSNSDIWTFNGAKISNEQISATTNNRTFVILHGSRTDYSYVIDGVEANLSKTGTQTDSVLGVLSLQGGNTHTHVFTANSSPVTVFILEQK